MAACPQTKGLSVLEHGWQVRDYFNDLIAHLEHGTVLIYEWRLPEWASPAILIYLSDLERLNTYQLYHDCGKPFCIEFDEQGRQHFPDHAAVSAKVAREHGFSESICTLIEKDMQIHLLKDVGVAAFCDDPDAISLLLTGLAEIHANAAMFGGIESVSFKQKWKQINRRGKKIVNTVINKSG